MTKLQRYQQIAEEYRREWTMERIKSKWGLTDRQIYRILALMDVALRGWR